LQSEINFGYRICFICSNPVYLFLDYSLLWTAHPMLVVGVDDYNLLIDHLYTIAEVMFSEVLHIINSWNVGFTVDNFGRVL
jgi:hypothetical protein